MTVEEKRSQPWKMLLDLEEFGRWTGTWPVEAVGAFMNLIERAWWSRSGLPADPADLALLARCKPKAWKQIWPLLEPHFPITDDGMRRNAYVEADYARAVKGLHQSRSAGSSGGRARWAKVVQFPEKGGDE